MGVAGAMALTVVAAEHHGDYRQHWEAAEGTLQDLGKRHPPAEVEVSIHGCQKHLGSARLKVCH